MTSKRQNHSTAGRQLGRALPATRLTNGRGDDRRHRETLQGIVASVLEAARMFVIAFKIDGRNSLAYMPFDVLTSKQYKKGDLVVFRIDERNAAVPIESDLP